MTIDLYAHVKSTGTSIGPTRASSGYKPRSCDCRRYFTVRGAYFAPRHSSSWQIIWHMLIEFLAWFPRLTPKFGHRNLDIPYLRCTKEDGVVKGWVISGVRIFRVFNFKGVASLRIESYIYMLLSKK